MQSPDKENLSLDSAIRHVLEECRMVLPGIQALFGFQLIAVFNDGFARKLTATEQQIHFVSTILTVIAIILVMTPAALHRQIDPLSVTRRLIESGTTLLLLSMLPLALSICLEIYLIAQLITGAAWLSILSGGGLFLSFLAMWVLFPMQKKRHKRS